jgi:hypothetical protein
VTTRGLYLLALLVGCQSKSRQVEPAPLPAIEVKDGSGATLAELRITRPCRATIEARELIVGGPPLIATLGATRWTGESQQNGTVLSRDGERTARVFPVGDPAAAAVFDMKGVALIRVARSGTSATVSEASGAALRVLHDRGTAIESDPPGITITGTDDLVLAAVFSAPELVPEVRMLAACERVLAAKGS